MFQDFFFLRFSNSLFHFNYEKKNSFMEGEHVVYSFSLWPQLQFLRKLLIYELVLSVSYMSKEFGKSFSFLG